MASWDGTHRCLGLDGLGQTFSYECSKLGAKKGSCGRLAAALWERCKACLRSEDGSYQVNKGHIFGTCLILVGVLTLFLFGLGAARMKLTPTVGILYIVTYLIFITYLILSEPRIRLLPELPV